jgi:hypothetical protein
MSPRNPPNGVMDADMTPATLLRKALSAISASPWVGRDTQSIAFLSTPLTDPLYSGEAIRKPL